MSFPRHSWIDTSSRGWGEDRDGSLDRSQRIVIATAIKRSIPIITSNTFWFLRCDTNNRRDDGSNDVESRSAQERKGKTNKSFTCDCGLGALVGRAIL